MPTILPESMSGSGGMSLSSQQQQHQDPSSQNGTQRSTPKSSRDPSSLSPMQPPGALRPSSLSVEAQDNALGEEKKVDDMSPPPSMNSHSRANASMQQQLDKHHRGSIRQSPIQRSPRSPAPGHSAPLASSPTSPSAQNMQQMSTPRHGHLSPSRTSLTQSPQASGQRSSGQMGSVLLLNRPPSTTSVMSGASQGAPSRNGTPATTTTSRRGGRTRCRSPPTMVTRAGSATHLTSSVSGSNGGLSAPPASGSPRNNEYGPPDDRSRPASRSEPSHISNGSGESPSMQSGAPAPLSSTMAHPGPEAAPPSPSNPSAVAAAAAATAKSLSSTPGGVSRSRPPTSTWGYPVGDSRGMPHGHDDRYARPASRGADGVYRHGSDHMKPPNGPPPPHHSSSRYSSYPPSSDGRYDPVRDPQPYPHHHMSGGGGHSHPRHASGSHPSSHHVSRSGWPPQDSDPPSSRSSGGRPGGYLSTGRHPSDDRYAYREGYHGVPPPDGYGAPPHSTAYGRSRRDRDPYYDTAHPPHHRHHPVHPHSAHHPPHLGGPEYDRRYSSRQAMHRPPSRYDPMRGGAHSSSGRESVTSPHPPSGMYDGYGSRADHGHSSRMHDPYYQSHAKMPPSSGLGHVRGSPGTMVPIDPSSAMQGRMDPKRSMTRVIGTPTPIHVPRAPGHETNQDVSSQSATAGGGSSGSVNQSVSNISGSSRSHGPAMRGRDGNASSVFRRAEPSLRGHTPSTPPRLKKGEDRVASRQTRQAQKTDQPDGGPENSSTNRKQRADEGDDESPHKLLMALRTPTSSFDEKAAGAGAKKKPAELLPLSLSLEAPPQIQHVHQKGDSESALLFDPQKSPKSQAGPPQQAASLDMAPSFSLFNQSFDSFGDTANYFNVGGPLDLSSASFGAGPIASIDPGDGRGELQLRRSGSTAQQILGGSASGALTFGMSPNNSFGGGPAIRPTGSMMLLGGQDGRSTSPTQVLGMYQSYSGGGSPKVKPNPPEDTQLRMSNSSSGSPSIDNAYTRSFNEAPAAPHRHSGLSPQAPPQQFPVQHPPMSADGSPGFYIFLRKYKEAFRTVSFLLPGLKKALAERKSSEEPTDQDPSPEDSIIAGRRITCAVCAFGGTSVKTQTDSSPSSPSTSKKSKQSQSIFREKSGESTTVTPESSASSASKTKEKRSYDDLLPTRYYENDNRLSWEFEERPPIDEMLEGDADIIPSRRSARNEAKLTSCGNNKTNNDAADNRNESEEDKKVSSGSSVSTSGETTKMKYRCKLCGQPKQNHTCPFQQSLARSIGTMTYPAVNAFTADEPGRLAPALTEMNNFISSNESVASDGTSPSRPTPDRMRRSNITHGISTAQVTPESLRGSVRGSSSPMSALSSGSTTPKRGSPGSRHGNTRKSKTPGSMTKKRKHSQMNGEDRGDLLFVDSMELRPEQFRLVSSSKALSRPNAFRYPALPLPYAQRKRLSDNLFSLSKQVEYLTDECAAVLREAREKDCWDLAVAELMTQVVVVVHCHDGDARFEGLRRYLLTLGISC